MIGNAFCLQFTSLFIRYIQMGGCKADGIFFPYFEQSFKKKVFLFHNNHY